MMIEEERSTRGLHEECKVELADPDVRLKLGSDGQGLVLFDRRPYGWTRWENRYLVSIPAAMPTPTCLLHTHDRVMYGARMQIPNE